MSLGLRAGDHHAAHRYHQHLLEGSTPDDDIGLGSLWSPLLYFNTREVFQQIIEGIDGKFLKIRSSDGKNVPSGFFFQLVPQRSRNHDGVQNGFLSLCRQG